MVSFFEHSKNLQSDYRAMVNKKLVKEGFGVLTWADGSKYEG